MYRDLSKANQMSAIYKKYPKVLIAEAKQYVMEYISENCWRLRSQASIFGALTLKVPYRYAEVVKDIFEANGAVLLSLEYEDPMTVERIVLMRYKSSKLGVLEYEHY